MKMKKRLLGTLVIVAMMLGMMSLPAMAAIPEGTWAEVTSCDFSNSTLSNNDCVIWKSGSAITWTPSLFSVADGQFKLTTKTHDGEYIMSFPKTDISTSAENGILKFTYKFKLQDAVTEAMPVRLKLFGILGSTSTYTPGASDGLDLDWSKSDKEFVNILYVSGAEITAIKKAQEYTMTAIINIDDGTYGYYIDGKKVVEDVSYGSIGTVQGIYLPYTRWGNSESWATEDVVKLYVDDLKVEKSVTPTIELNVGYTKAPAGYKVALNTNRTYCDGDLIYTVNGEDMPAVDADTYNVVLKEGTNTFSVRSAVNETLASQTVTVEGLPYSLTEISNKNFDNETLTPETGKEILDISEGDSAHKKVGHLTRTSEATQNKIFNKWSQAFSTTYSEYNIHSYTWDLKILHMEDATNNQVVYIDSGSGVYRPFVFKNTDGNLKLHIISALENSNDVIVPLDNEWHKYQIIFDDNNDIIYNIFDGTVYSAVSFAKTPFITKNGKCFPEFLVASTTGNTNKCEFYIDNICDYYGGFPTTYSEPVYTSGNTVVSNMSDVDAEKDLNVTFSLMKNENVNSVVCFATINDTSTSLMKCVGIDRVSFVGGETYKTVNIALSDLPQDIATNPNYTINIFVWEDVSLKPLFGRINTIE